MPEGWSDEVTRLQTLHRYDILDTDTESAFDRIAGVAQTVAQVPVAMVNFVDEDRRWCKAFTGHPARELPREVSFCSHAIRANETVHVPDATLDRRFADNPLVTATPFMRFYLGVPLCPDAGCPIGTLCVIDHVPRRLTDAQQTALDQLGRLAERELVFRQHAYSDPLTGALNRRLFFQMAEKENSRLERTGGALSIAYLDVDHFQAVNDTYGHETGDRVLAAVARTCQANIRAQDTLFRLGGEEFAILLPETSASEAAAIAERVRRAVAARAPSDDHAPLPVTISVGVASQPASRSRIAQDLLAGADRAMYGAKRGGRNRVVTGTGADGPNDEPPATSGRSRAVSDAPRHQPDGPGPAAGGQGSEPRVPGDFGHAALDASVAELAQLGFWVWDQAAQRTVDVSPGMAQLFGLSRQGYLNGPGRPEQMFAWFHPDDRARYRQIWHDQAQNGCRYRIEVRFLRQDGNVRHAREIGDPVQGPDGRLRWIVGTFQDITETKTRERELEQRVREQSALADIANETLRYRDPAPLWEAVVRTVMRSVDADRGAFLQIEADGNTVVRTIQGDDAAGARRAIDSSLSCLEIQVARTHRTMARSSSEDVYPTALGPDGSGSESALAAPVAHPEIRDGVLAVYGAVPGTFDSSSAAFLASAASMLAGALARIAADHQRHTAQDQLQNIADNLPGLIYRRRHWPDGRMQYEYLSERLREFVGVDPEQARATPDAVLDRVHPEDRPKLQQALAAGAGAAATNQQELRVRDADDVERVLHNTSRMTAEPDGSVRIDGIALDVTERRAAERQISYERYNDLLTALPNSAAFQQSLRDALARCVGTTRTVGVAVLDLDDFTSINNAYGRSVGDQLLIKVSARLQQTIRAGDTVSRMNADRFLVLFDGLRSSDNATRLIQRVREAFTKPFVIADGETLETYKVTASIGFVVHPDDGASADDLLVNAEAALTSAQAHGPGSYDFYSQEFTARRRHYLDTEAALDRAIERDEFEVYYQPKVAAATGRLAGFEALVRWRHPTHGLLTPGRFLEVAEQTGQVIAINRIVLNKVCALLRRWTGPAASGLAPPTIAINVSAHDLTREGFLHDLDTALSTYAVAPQRLEIELTESTLMRDLVSARQILVEVRAREIAIAVDDFGTGYSSLQYLTELPFDSLKIDRTFVDKVADDPSRLRVVDSVVNLARGLSKRVVAEGVETATQRRILAEHGADELQGFGIARPMPETEAERLDVAVVGRADRS